MNSLNFLMKLSSNFLPINPDLIKNYGRKELCKERLPRSSHKIFEMQEQTSRCKTTKFGKLMYTSSPDKAVLLDTAIFYMFFVDAMVFTLNLTKKFFFYSHFKWAIFFVHVFSHRCSKARET